MSNLEETLAGYVTPCAEMDALAEELALLGVPFVAEAMRVEPEELAAGPLTIGWHLVYGAGRREVSVIWSWVSYGREVGLLEAWDYDERGEPRGWLTAGEVLHIWPPEVPLSGGVPE